MFRLLALFMAAASTLASIAQAQPASKPLQTINVITFGGSYNIPAGIAQRQLTELELHDG